jgi:hypothetical protein
VKTTKIRTRKLISINKKLEQRQINPFFHGVFKLLKVNPRKGNGTKRDMILLLDWIFVCLFIFPIFLIKFQTLKKQNSLGYICNFLLREKKKRVKESGHQIFKSKLQIEEKEKKGTEVNTEIIEIGFSK